MYNISIMSKVSDWRCFTGKQIEFFHKTFMHYQIDGTLTNETLKKVFHKIGSLPSENDFDSMRIFPYFTEEEECDIEEKSEFSEAEFFLILYHYFRNTDSKEELLRSLSLFADLNGCMTKEFAEQVLKCLKHPISKSTVEKIMNNIPGEKSSLISVSDLVNAIEPYCFS